MGYICPVCGYPNLTEAPRTEQGGGSYEICPSCGFQFGVTDDDTRFSYAEWRDRWIREGMPWNKTRSNPPTGWDPREQLRRIGH